MLELLKGSVGQGAAPFVFLAIFLVIGGGALWLTPRIAKWMDKNDQIHKGFYDDMLTEDPNAKQENKNEENTDV